MRVFAIIFTLSLFLFACSDECDDVLCLNDGICNDGDCECPIQYEGDRCQNQVTPSSIKIESVTVTNISPLSPSGVGWDYTSAADLYLVIGFVQGNQATILYTSDVRQDANVSAPQTYAISNRNVILDRPLDRYEFNILDRDDFDEDCFMGGVSFIPYSANNGFPAQSAIPAPTGETYTVDFTYRF